jgi:hypothetical protein
LEKERGTDGQAGRIETQGENDGAQGGKCKWQSVDKQGWRR